MPWTVVNFGKFRGKGKTLPQIIFTDPDWFFHLIEDDGFANKGALAAEAADINKKARRIRIPHQPGQSLEAEYIVDPLTLKFGGVQVVPADKPIHVGGSSSWRRPVLDMSVPRAMSNYDKSGYQLLILDLKTILFSGAKTRMTKQLAESFFDRVANFQL